MRMEGNFITRPLASKELSVCVKLAKEGNQVARSKLITSHGGMVLQMVKSFSNNKPWLNGKEDDLVQESLIGVDTAIKLYDSNEKASFTSYCKFWITAKLTEYNRNYSRIVHVPANHFDSKNKFCKELSNVKCVNVLSNMPGSTTKFIDIIEDQQDQVKSNRIEFSKADLTDQEKSVMSLLFNEDLSNSEIGIRIGTSRQRVDQIRKKALNKIREHKELYIG